MPCRSRADLEAELDALLAPVDPEDLEQQMERLRQFAHGNMLRVAAADLTGGVPLMKVSDYLTEIAEVAVARVLRPDLRPPGRPPWPPRRASARATPGSWSWATASSGGLELGYGSDLDLVFLHGSDSASAETAGPKPISRPSSSTPGSASA